MSTETLNLTPELLGYLRAHSFVEHPVQTELREYTAAMPDAIMQISPEQGKFMQFMAQLTGAKRCLEVGVFTGYSSLSVALGLPDDGVIHAFDISEEWTSVGKAHWERAGVADKIKLSLGPAIDGLQKLIRAGEEGSFDFAFIDADKGNYKHYYELCLTLLKPGGLILIDNVLWSGRVADPENQEEDTVAIREINDIVLADARVDQCMLPISDGITIVRKV
jgi:predicted O-methyltransferase YrrM